MQCLLVCFFKKSVTFYIWEDKIAFYAPLKQPSFDFLFCT